MEAANPADVEQGFRVCALFGPAFPAYVVGHLVAQGFQPFSFARKLSGVNIKYHNDSAGTCKPWTHKTNMTPNLLFVTIIKRYPEPKRSQL